MLVREAIGEQLADLGVRVAFGVVGSGNFHYTNALMEHGARFVAARHEGGAATMADAYARMSGEVAVLSLHQGCGYTNALTGIAEAAKSRTPLLVLTAEATEPTSNFFIDQAGMAEGAGALAHRVRLALSPATPGRLLTPFRERFGVALLDGYGSTETNAVVATRPGEERPGYIGTLQPGFHMRVVDADGADVPLGTPGELLLRSDQPFAFASGYFRMPEATTAAWQDLWFHTGDRVCAEAGGSIRFVDRIKDVIRRRGENISSVEVEDVLRGHPAVAEVAVYAVDSELGEDEVMAAVVAKEGAQLDFEDLVEFCGPRLAAYAIPRFLVRLDALPLTENGKVRKPELRSRGTDGAWDRQPPRPQPTAPDSAPTQRTSHA